MMKRILSTLIIGLGLLMSLQTSSAETIKIGYFSHEPFHYLDETSGKARGAAITYFETVAAKMGYTVEWVGPLPYIRMRNDLMDGTIDGYVGFTFNPEYKESLYFGDKPFYAAETIFIVRQENPLTQIVSIQDVEGYRVGWLVDTFASPFVQNNLAHFQMDYIAPGDTMWEQSLLKLLDGRLDAIHDMNAHTLPFIAAKMHILEQFKVLPLPEAPEPLYVVFSQQSPHGKTLIEQYNAVQAAMPFAQEDYVKLIQQEFDILSHP